MKKTLKWIVVVTVLAGVGWWFYSSKLKKEVEVKPTYERAKVELRDLRAVVESTGEVQPRNRLDVKPPIAGRLEELLVDEGDLVDKGQVLGWVSSTERATLLDAALATSEDELEYWQELYKPSPLVSPLKGTIIVRNFEPGQSINANDAVVVIADDLIVVANLDETDIGQVKLGQKVEAHLEAYPDTRFECVVEKIAYDARMVSNVTMYDVDVRADVLPDFARSGMTANLEFILEERYGVLAVDSAAVMESNQPEDDEAQQADVAEGGEGKEDRSERLFGKRDGMAEVLIESGDPEAPIKKEVKIGISDGSYTEIIEGLEEGDEVLVEKIKTGQHEGSRSPFMPKRKKKK